MAAEGRGSRLQGGSGTTFLRFSVVRETQNEQTVAEGLRDTDALSGLPAFLQVFRASPSKVSKRLQRGMGDGCRELIPVVWRLKLSP